MKKNRFKIIIILLFIVGAVWALLPTYRAQQYRSGLADIRDSAARVKYQKENLDSYKQDNTKAIKLGLDLRGGIYVTMEVDVLKFIEEQANQKDEIFNQVIAATHNEVEKQESGEAVTSVFVRNFKQIASPKGKALANYFFLNEARTSDDADIQAALQKGADEAVDRAIEIIRNRIDQFGLTEPTIQKQGSRRVIIELPGEGDPAQVHQLLEGTAQLEFRLVKEPRIVQKVIDRIDKFMVGDSASLRAPVKDSASIAKATVDSLGTKPVAAIAAKKDSAKKGQDVAKAGDSTKAAAPAVAAVTPEDSAKRADSLAYAGLNDKQKAEKFQKEHPFSYVLAKGATQDGRYYVTEEDRNWIQSQLNRSDIKSLLADEMTFSFSRPIKNQEGANVYQVHFLNAQPELTGKVITDARSDISPSNGQPEVTMQMDEEGARVWKRVTTANVGKQIAIVLDNVVYSAPVVNGPIPNGNSSITGSGDMAEANLLKIVLKAGALPAPVKIIQEQVVGPSLGADSISKGTQSILFAFLAVMLFMAMYYVTGGIAADIAVLINMLFTLAILATFGATLTLPGMAGLVLTVGIAVDANVLIYERIREELANGKSLKLALDDGYKRAFAPIFDGHLTALFSAIILYAFGTGTVQGFAVTLMIGIAASLFTAIVITRVLFDVLLETNPGAVKFG